MTPGRLVWIAAVLSAASTASAPEFAKTTRASDLVHRPNVSATNSRASFNFNSFGCTSPIACNNFPACALDRRHDARVGMTDVRHAKRRRQIEIAVAIDIPHVGTRRALPKDRPMVGNVRDVPRFVTTQLTGEGAGLRAGDAGLQQWQQIFHNTASF